MAKPVFRLSVERRTARTKIRLALRKAWSTVDHRRDVAPGRVLVEPAFLVRMTSPLSAREMSY